MALQLNSRLDLIVFIYAFTWIFVLSSAMPNVVLGKGKESILLQYFLVLALTLSALFVQNFLSSYVEGVFGFATFFKNPYFAIFYLSAPYLLMIAYDIQVSRSKKKMNMQVEDTLTSKQL